MHGIRESLAFAVLLGACSEPGATPEPQPYTVLTPDVWAGQDLLITSPGFSRLLGSPGVSLNGVSANTRFVNDTTLAVATPSARGSYVLTVSSPFVMDVPATIFLRGFVAQEAGPLVFGRLEIIPGPPAVFAQLPDGVLRWDIVGRNATRLLGIQHDGRCVGGIGSSYTPTHLVLHSGPCPSGGEWKVWSIEATPIVVDSLQITGDHLSVELAPEKAMQDYFHEFVLIDCDTCAWLWITAEGVKDVVFSPQRHRLVPLRANFPPDGVPIVEPATATVVYRIAPIRAPMGAAFSVDGDTLFVGGPSGLALDAPFHIVRARATDGQVDTVIDVQQSVVAMAVDPVRPWLYIAVNLPPSLDVWDRRTMSRIASIPIPSIPCLCFWSTKILPSPLEHRVYVAATLVARGTPSQGDEAPLFVFDTPR